VAGQDSTQRREIMEFLNLWAHLEARARVPHARDSPPVSGVEASAGESRGSLPPQIRAWFGTLFAEPRRLEAWEGVSRSVTAKTRAMGKGKRWRPAMDAQAPGATRERRVG
jgi:hypothetical protein